MFDATDFYPLGPGRRRSLHEEELTCCAIGISLHHHSSVLQVRQKDGRNVNIVLEEIAFCDAKLRPKQFVEVRQLHNPTGNIDLEPTLVLRELDGGKLLCAQGWN